MFGALALTDMLLPTETSTINRTRNAFYSVESTYLADCLTFAVL